MAAASLVATAVGVLLLLVTGYLLASGIIFLTETVMSAEKDMTALQVSTLGTSIRIEGSLQNGTELTRLSLNNTGAEKINDIESMDVYLRNNVSMEFYPSSRWTGTSISPNSINPASWDPGETLEISLNAVSGPYIWTQATTPNGVSASAYL